MGTPFARGAFFGLTPRTGTGTMVRAIMEGVTFELRRTLEIVEDAGNMVQEQHHRQMASWMDCLQHNKQSTH